VALDVGPKLVAHLHAACVVGEPVRLSLKLDPAGRGAVYAAPVDAAPDPKTGWGAAPAGRNVLIVDGRASTAPALAAAFRQEGATRILVGLAERWRPAPAVEGVEIVSLDPRDAKSVEELAKLYGDKVDILVANADRFRPGDPSPRENFELHALGLLRLMDAFGPAMRARAAEAGRSAAAFVTILSAVCLTGSSEHPAYAASQAAARALSAGFRAQSRASGLRVVDVLTGPIDDVWRQSIRPPKVAPAALAAALVAGLQQGLEEIVVGEIARQLHAKWAEDPRLLRQETP
jgi:short-subunit dehydrogenase